MTCPDLCTAAKCQELEERIGRLEQNLELLEAAFEAHTDLNIPEAHDYIEPDNHVESNLAISASWQPETLTISVADGESQDTTQVNIPLPEEENHVESNLSISASWESEILTISVADGESEDTTQVNIPLPEDNHVESNLRLSGSYFAEVLTLSVADGESQDTTQILIPIQDSFNDTNNPIPPSSGGDTVFITEEIYMNCDQLENEIKDCCDQLINLINNNFSDLNNKIINLENVILDDIGQVKEVVTVDISGTTNGDYNCQFPLDENDTPLPTYAESIKVQKSYSGIGLEGLHENLKLINANLDAIHTDICKAVDPLSSITIDDLYKFCDTSAISREDYGSDEAGQTAYEAAVQTYLDDLFEASKYSYLLAQATGNILIEAPNNITTQILTDFSLIQGKINSTDICNLEIPEATESEVVAIVASDKVIPRVNGKKLILHFVTFENYPTREPNSSYRPIQIPMPKETYDWETDFAGLVWQQGNCYARLYFEEFVNPVSGFFDGEVGANAFFDAVLSLTTATQTNRVISKHDAPKTNIPIRPTRPYRAFIVEANLQGKAVCHTKYVPPLEPEES